MLFMPPNFSSFYDFLENLLGSVTKQLCYGYLCILLHISFNLCHIIIVKDFSFRHLVDHPHNFTHMEVTFLLSHLFIIFQWIMT